MAKSSEWWSRVEAWQSSGQSAREFCEGREFTAKGLQWWASQFRRAGKPSQGGKRVALARIVRTASPVVASKPSPIVVRFERACVEVPVGADGATLGAVFEALRTGGSR